MHLVCSIKLQERYTEKNYNSKVYNERGTNLFYKLLCLMVHTGACGDITLYPNRFVLKKPNGEYAVDENGI